MDIIEAEQFFKQYCGLEFHMGREEPKKYNSYRELNTSDDMKEKWRQELIREKLKALRTSSGKTSPDTWCVHSSLIEIIMNTKTAHMDKIIASCHTDNESNEQCERYQNAVYNYQAIL